MKNLMLLVSICFLTQGALVANAQREAPAGASDKSLSDRSVKDRSMELERIKRDAAKPEIKNQQVPTAPMNFEEIKDDFENIQRLQDEILKAYSAGKQMDLEKLALSAEQFNKRSVRLETNLFPPVVDQKNKKRSKQEKRVETTPEPTQVQDVKALIFEQDNTLAAFVGNPMFTNPNVANVDDNAKAHADLKKLIRLSQTLKLEAEKRTN